MSTQDPENKAVPTIATSHHIFHDLVNALNSRRLDTPLAVEVLLNSHPLPPGAVILVEENTIGIHKKALVQAFLTARHILFDNIGALPEKEVDLLNASAVILFFDPEHLTAANVRKRVIHNRLSKSGDGGQKSIDMDLWFSEGLLTSFLPRHTKSPTLWSHRRWLLQQSAPFLDHQRLRELTVVATTAAEHHPRNYYAWDYVRCFIGALPDAVNLFSQDSEIATYVPRESPDMPVIIAFYLSWCLKHPSDTSGWSFLLWLLTSSTAISLPNQADMITQVGMEVLKAAKSLRLKNESLWFFLRTLVTSGDAHADLRQTYQEEKKFMAMR